MTLPKNIHEEGKEVKPGFVVSKEKMAKALLAVWINGVAACTDAAIKEYERQRVEWEACK